MKRYNPKEIEPKWQQVWDERQTYKADLASNKPKYIAMSMFNYPSGAGIHIGHAMNYTISDVMARYKRQQGYESYHPIGWDAFGLPAENYAIKTGVSPQASMATIIPGYHKQYKAMGWSNDWSKEISTHLPIYYKWTQWIFAQMFKNGLAYQDSRMQWWCTKCQTVLANEQVIDGKCWRHDAPDDPLVEKKEIKQWFFKITEYADELLEATDDLDWSEVVKTAQKNWIGKSKGAEVDFAIEGAENYVSLHGFTGSPENDFHPWLKSELEKYGSKVTVPALPDTNKPDAKTQAAYVLSEVEFDENSVLLGHSYGTVTALRVVEQLTKPIKRLVLIAAFAEPGFLDNERVFESTTDWQFDFEKIKNNVKEIIILRAQNDSAVPPARSDFLKVKLDATIVDFVASEDHVCGTVEPVVLKYARKTLTVFTTRPDTLFGATFMVIAPEHDLVASLTTDEQRAAVEQYVKEAEKKSEVERQASKEKTGVFTGSYAVNPINGSKIPIWIADYVLVGYGTGAIMAVPAHDERDWQFATKYTLPIIPVVEPVAGQKQGDEVEKEAIVAVVRNPKDGKLLVLGWGPRMDRWGGTLFIGGGIDEGEDPVACAKREIAEETGYTNVKFIKSSNTLVHSYYYSNVKDKNYYARVRGMLFELEDDSKQDVTLDEGEKNKFTVKWLPESQAVAAIDDSAHSYVYQLLHEDVHNEEGQMINSGAYDGMSSSDAREKIVADLETKGYAVEKTMFKIRDWSVSRQRYWGAPIPIVNCPKDGVVLIPDEQLPVVLPELVDFQPSGDGRSALARATDWLHTTCPKCGGPAERETDTLDTYICSSWYMLRYFDPANEQKAFEPSVANKWMPVDFYNGGDHATAHMIYARFVTRFFHKLGLLDNPEPFKKFLFNGKITAADGQMFSKSKGNGVDPLEIIDSGYGADALRTYLMFAAPLDLWIRWDPQGVPGTYRFLNRVWNIVQDFLAITETNAQSDDAVLRVIHPAIRKVTEDLEEQKYNTAIAAMMKATNELYELKAKTGFDATLSWRVALESLVMLVAPFAPHMAEELWHELGHEDSVHIDHWPTWDDTYLLSDTIVIVAQVNGKVRAELTIAAGASKEEIIAAASSDEKVQNYLAGHEIKKTIVVPNKLVNFVI